MAIADWSATASENALVLGVNIGENCPAANMNNALRQAMADVAGGIDFSVLGTFLASTSLSQARSALGVASPTSNTSLTNLGNLTNAANKVPYMTGSDNWSTADFTSFGRSVVACADAATLVALLGVLGGATASASANTGTITIPLAASFTLKIQWGTGSIGGDSTSSVSYSSYSVAPLFICCGGPSDTASEGSVHNYGTPGTTSASIINTSGLTNTYVWVALGKA